MHRVGRTGRAGAAGVAITLLPPSGAAFAEQLEDMLAERAGSGGDAQQPAAAAQQAAAAAADSGSSSSDEDEAGGSGAARRQRRGGAGGLQPHGRLTKAAVEGLRYRAEDVARSITKNVIKEVSESREG